MEKDESAEFKIIEFNKEYRKVVASHTSTFKQQKPTKSKSATKKPIADNKEKTTLGDIDALADLKEKMNDD